MRILFVSKDFYPLKGGIQTSVDKLAIELDKRGHRSAVLTQLPLRFNNNKDVLSARIARKFLKRPILLQEETKYYPVYRIKHPQESVPLVINSFNPDVMVIALGGFSGVQFTRDVAECSSPTPIAIYSCDIQAAWLTGDPYFKNSHIIANAEVIASLVAVLRNRPKVIPCIVDYSDYLIKSTREVILYINPHPRKGENIAWAIAEAAPELRFVFQESWPLNDKARNRIIAKAKQLKNVEFRPVNNQPADIYRDARILIAPYGPERPRVIDEAQANGIPVVAHNFPGLDESVGTGGILINPHSTVQQWITVLNKLCFDTQHYKDLSIKALNHSRRPEMRSEYLAELFEDELKQIVSN